MAPRGWRTALIAPARDLKTGRPTQVLTGAVQLDGRKHVAIRRGDGDSAIMGDQATRQLIANLHTALEEQGQ